MKASARSNSATPTEEEMKRAAKYRMAQADEALLRLCRLCVSIKMHTQGMSVDEATKFFQENCYYEEKPARAEAMRGTFDPGYLNYTLGKLQILKLRDDYEAQEGDKFSLKKFHDEMLNHGMPPDPPAPRDHAQGQGEVGRGAVADTPFSARAAGAAIRPVSTAVALYFVVVRCGATRGKSGCGLEGSSSTSFSCFSIVRDFRVDVVHLRRSLIELSLHAVEQHRRIFRTRSSPPASRFQTSLELF